MNLRPHRRAQADINLTPLIDVVFLLLIFFMVSTTFKDEVRLRVQLPQAQGEEAPTREPDIIRILIDQAGRFVVDDQALADGRTGTLVEGLKRALGARADAPVLIQADAQTPHQAVMQALTAARQTGLVRVAFAATAGDGSTTDAVGQSAGEPSP